VERPRDSIVVVGGDGIWNCHIHTDDVGAAIEAGIEAGRPSKLHVTDLWEQVEALEADWVAAAAPVETRPCAVVAVATGDGVTELLRHLGVAVVVSGGQSMNPSTQADPRRGGAERGRDRRRAAQQQEHRGRCGAGHHPRVPTGARRAHPLVVEALVALIDFDVERPSSATRRP